MSSQALPLSVQPPLCPPGDTYCSGVLALLAARDGSSDRGPVAVVMGRLDQQPACVCGAGLGDRALATLAVGGVLGGNDAKEAESSAGFPKPPPVSDLGA